MATGLAKYLREKGFITDNTPLAIDGQTGKLFLPETRYKLADCADKDRQMKLALELNAEYAKRLDEQDRLLGLSKVDEAALDEELARLERQRNPVPSGAVPTLDFDVADVDEAVLDAEIVAAWDGTLREDAEYDRLFGELGLSVQPLPPVLANLVYAKPEMPVVAKPRARAGMLKRRGKSVMSVTIQGRTYRLDTDVLRDSFGVDMTLLTSRTKCGADACTMIDLNNYRALKTGDVLPSEVERQRLAHGAGISPAVYTDLLRYEVLEPNGTLKGFAMEAYADSLAGLLYTGGGDASLIVDGLRKLIQASLDFGYIHGDLHADNIVYRIQDGAYQFAIIDWSTVVDEALTPFSTALQWLSYGQGLVQQFGVRQDAWQRSICNVVMAYLEHNRQQQAADAWYTMMTTLVQNYRQYFVGTVQIRVGNDVYPRCKPLVLRELRCGSRKFALKN
jgi:hypothetical protein